MQSSRSLTHFAYWSLAIAGILHGQTADVQQLPDPRAALDEILATWDRRVEDNYLYRGSCRLETRESDYVNQIEVQCDRSVRIVDVDVIGGKRHTVHMQNSRYAAVVGRIDGEQWRLLALALRGENGYSECVKNINRVDPFHLPFQLLPNLREYLRAGRFEIEAANQLDSDDGPVIEFRLIFEKGIEHSEGGSLDYLNLQVFKEKDMLPVRATFKLTGIEINSFWGGWISVNETWLPTQSSLVVPGLNDDMPVATYSCDFSNWSEPVERRRAFLKYYGITEPKFDYTLNWVWAGAGLTILIIAFFVYRRTWRH